MVVDNQLYLVEIQDTAGQEALHILHQDYIRHSDGFIIVYAINDDPGDGNSFKHVEKYHNEILAYRDDDVPVAIAANKSDLEDQRTVTREDGRDLAERLNASFVETSAKTNTNVEKVFEDICRDVIRRRRHTTKKFTFATPSNSECDSDSSSDEDLNCLERCFRSCCCFVGRSKRKT